MSNMPGTCLPGMGPFPPRSPALVGLLLIGLQWLGCATPPQKTPGDLTKYVPGLRPGDLRHCAEEMARDLVAHPLLQRSDRPVWISIVSIDNHTNEPFVGGSADMVVRKIQTLVLRACKGQNRAHARFVVSRRSLVEAMAEEAEARAAGMVAGRATGRRAAIDCFLSGVYHELAKSAGGAQIVEMLMTFTLTDAVTGEEWWAHDCPVKTVTPN